MTKLSLTIPSLSGTCRKRYKPTHKPNLRQEPSIPSHSIAWTEQQCIIEQIIDKIGQGQRTINRTLSGQQDPAMSRC